MLSESRIGIVELFLIYFRHDKKTVENKDKKSLFNGRYISESDTAIHGSGRKNKIGQIGHHKKEGQKRV